MKQSLLPALICLLVACNPAGQKGDEHTGSDPAKRAAVSTASVVPADGHHVVVSHVSGDLNKDGLADSVMVTQDTLSSDWPFRLQIFFANKDGSFSQALSSDSAIAAARPDGDNNGNSFYEATIMGNVLTLSVQLIRGTYHHLFRYQHNRFELIGFNYANSNGDGTMEKTDFNLSTGHAVLTKESYETDKVLSKKDTVIHISPLPDLATFTPMSTDVGAVLF